ncbi:PH domain-containing protein [Clostridium perfringens]|nr:hypothetical protein [Clostridium perfringens]EHK2440460.1 PH domain-containing protein [Clostridium perfringens]
MRGDGNELIRVASKNNFYTESIKKRDRNKEFLEVEKLLVSGEQIKTFILDLYGDKSSYIFCTDLRIIYLEKKENFQNEKFIFFEKIKCIESDLNLNKGRIRISLEDDYLLIENLSEKTIRYIIDLYKYYREKNKSFDLKEKKF